MNNLKQWNKSKIAGVLILAALLVAGCIFGLIKVRNGHAHESETQYDLVVYSPHSAEFISTLVEEFESETGIRVKVVSKSSGELLNDMEKNKEPQCDILWGGSLFTIQTHPDLFERYISVNEDAILADFKNTEGSYSRFTDVPSVLIVNTDLIGDIAIRGYEDLLQPELKGKIACGNPSTSSSAFEHLTNILYAMGKGNPENGWGYVNRLCENMNGEILNSSSAVHEGVANGEYIVGLTFEEPAAGYVAEGKHVKIIYMAEGVVSTPDCACVIKNAKHREAAHAFIDFVTGFSAQQMIATHLNRRSVREDVELPEYLCDKSNIHIIYADSTTVVRNRVHWTERFEEIINRISEAK